MNFDQWLEYRDIDIQTIEPEMLAALQSQYEREQQRLAPVGTQLIVPVNCAWPQRGHWIPVAL